MSQSHVSELVIDDAAPLGSARQTSAISGCHRIRRRGPRSDLATLRRSVPKYRRTLPDISPGESGDVISEINIQNESQCNNSFSKSTPDLAGSNSKMNGISILSINIQCLAAKLAELIYHLEMHRPHVVLIQETWLDATTKDVQIAGYSEVSRRDRHEGANRGGILTLQRDDFNGLVHIRNCEDEERSWHFLRLGVDTFLVANWYRPGASTHTTFANV